jgi:polyphosphate glucokinase
MTSALGIDIGGTGIKAAPVDLETGELLAQRHRLDTPRPGTPDAVTGVLGQLRDHFDWDGVVGVAFPGVVRNNTILTAANLHRDWVGKDAAALFSNAVGRRPVVINDADAAGVAEVRFGAGHNIAGTVVLITVGTGIGTAVFTDGHLLANTELGHLDIDGQEAEARASARVKEDEDLSWKKWSKRLRTFLMELERVLWPDLFVIGGGISKDFAKYCQRFDLDTPVTQAVLLNRAGIVGAALTATKS